MKEIKLNKELNELFIKDKLFINNIAIDKYEVISDIRDDIENALYEYFLRYDDKTKATKYDIDTLSGYVKYVGITKDNNVVVLFTLIQPLIGLSDVETDMVGYVIYDTNETNVKDIDIIEYTYTSDFDNIKKYVDSIIDENKIFVTNKKI